jgi:hypothetical protein
MPAAPLVDTLAPPEPEPLAPPLVCVELPAVPALAEPLAPTTDVPALPTGAPALPALEVSLELGSDEVQPNTLTPKAHKPKPQQRVNIAVT